MKKAIKIKNVTLIAENGKITIILPKGYSGKKLLKFKKANLFLIEELKEITKPKSKKQTRGENVKAKIEKLNLILFLYNDIRNRFLSVPTKATDNIKANILARRITRLKRLFNASIKLGKYDNCESFYPDNMQFSIYSRITNESYGY